MSAMCTGDGWLCSVRVRGKGEGLGSAMCTGDGWLCSVLVCV